MIKVREAIVVEGKYDKNTLAQLIDAPIFTTAGFGVMKDRELLRLLRRVAAQRGLIILTDSDGAGFVIRNYLKGALPKEQVKHAYIPDIYGKERRKAAPGKEGKLGVEGMCPDILLQALKNAGATVEGESQSRSAVEITVLDFYELGFTGGKDSQARRKALQRRLCLPEHMSTSAVLQTLNLLLTKEELYALAQELSANFKKPSGRSEIG